MLEKEVQKPVVVHAEDYGMIAIKMNGEGNRGKPDYIFHYRNRSMVIEFKKPGETPTKLQEMWLGKFRDQGFRAIAIDNIGKGKTAIDKFKAEVDVEYEEGLFDDLQ